MTDRPLVTVIMPAYNAERYIAKSIESVLNQTCADLELIIINDCSKDNTLQIAHNYAHNDSRIKIIDNHQNIGVAKSRNEGFDAATGSWVALLDSDDIWHSDKLEKQLDTAKKTNADLVYCSYGIIDENGNKFLEDFIVPPSTDFKSSLVISVISCSTVMLSHKIASQHRFATEYYHEDLVYWLDVLRDGYTAAGVTEVLAQYRVAKGSRASNKLKSAYNRWVIFRRHLKLPLLQSIICILQYAFAGIKKYSR